MHWLTQVKYLNLFQMGQLHHVPHINCEICRRLVDNNYKPKSIEDMAKFWSTKQLCNNNFIFELITSQVSCRTQILGFCFIMLSLFLLLHTFFLTHSLVYQPTMHHWILDSHIEISLENLPCCSSFARFPKHKILRHALLLKFRADIFKLIVIFH